jgi:hypothetical protein
MKTSVTHDETAVEPVFAREGEGPVYAVRVPGVTTGITGTPTMTFYKQNTATDLSSTYLTGSCSVSGTDVIVTKTFQSLKAGPWVWDILATVDGVSRIVITVPFIVKRRSEV